MNDFSSETVVMGAADIASALRRMADAVRSMASDGDDLVLIGIQRRGAELAERLGRLIEDNGKPVSLGALDITFYRDDFRTVGPKPVVGQTSVPFDLTDKCVVIVDDVLYTGRTVRAALDELRDFGRPRRIGLCVLVDRGGRELPIQADIVGDTVNANEDERVDVLIKEVDGTDEVRRVVREAS